MSELASPKKPGPTETFFVFLIFWGIVTVAAGMWGLRLGDSSSGLRMFGLAAIPSLMTTSALVSIANRNPDPEVQNWPRILFWMGVAGLFWLAYIKLIPMVP